MVWRNRLVQLIIKLREVKQLKETAVCESMHGGVRGRASNPPTYSIMSGMILSLQDESSYTCQARKETLAIGKGVMGDYESERSHQQNWKSWRTEIWYKAHREGNRAMDWERPKSTVNSMSKSGETQWKFSSLSREILHNAPVVQME